MNLEENFLLGAQLPTFLSPVLQLAVRRFTGMTKNLVRAKKGQVLY